MLRFLLLLTFFLPLAAAWGQKPHFVFQEAPLSSALQTIDQHFPDTHIQYIVDEVAPYRVTATIEQESALEALRDLLSALPFVIEADGNNLFINRDLLAWSLQNNHSDQPSAPILLDEVLVLEHLPFVSLPHPSFVLQIEGTELAHRGSAAELLNYLPGVLCQSGITRMLDQSTPLIYIDDEQVSSPTELVSLRSEEISRISMLDGADAEFPSQAGTIIQIRTHAAQPGWNVQALASVAAGHYTSHQEHLKIGWHADRQHLTAGMVSQDNRNYQEHLTSGGEFVYSPRIASVNPYLQSSFRCQEHHLFGLRYELLNVTNDVNYTSRLFSLLNTGAAFNNIDVEGLAHQGEWTLRYSPRHDARLFYAGSWPKAKVRFDLEYYGDALDIDADESLFTTSDRNYQEFHNSNGIRNDLWSERFEVHLPFAHGDFSFGNELTSTSRRDTYHHHSNIDLSALREERQASGFMIGEYRFAKLRLRAGIRGEWLQTDFHRGLTHKHFSRNFLLPHVDIVWPASSAQLTLSYSSNTHRPSYSQLNGYTRYNQYMMYVNGNPDLRPALHHNFSGQLRLRDLYLNLRYRHIKDYVAQAVYRSEEAYLTDYFNLPSANDLLLTASYSPKLRRWSPILSASLLRQDLSLSFGDGSRQRLNRPVFFVDVHSPFSLSSRSQCWLDYHFHTTGHIGSSLHQECGSLDLGISHQLGRFTLRLQAEDLLKTGTTTFENYGQRFTYLHQVYNDSQRVMFTIQYLFDNKRFMNNSVY